MHQAGMIIVLINVLIIGSSVVWMSKDLDRTKIGPKRNWLLAVIFLWMAAMPYYLYKTRGKKAAIVFFVVVFGVFILINFFTPLPRYLHMLVSEASP